MINSPLVIIDKILIIHSNNQSYNLALFYYPRFYLAKRLQDAYSVYTVIIPEPSYDTDAETE